MKRLLCAALFLWSLLAGNAVYAQVANFSASPTTGCSPLSVRFTDISAGTVTSWAWDFGNGAPISTLQSPNTTYSAPGSYTVTLTVTGSAGSNTKTVTGYITVYDQPAVAFAAAAPLAGCTPHNVQFSSTVTANAPGAATYAWDFGDGTTGSGNAPAHTYTTAGIYSVSLTVTNSAGCSRTVVQNAYITAYPLPHAAFVAGQQAFCSAPAAVSFTSTSVNGTAPFSYGWSFGDGGTGTGSSVSHSYTTGGSFDVRLTVTDVHGCIDTARAPGYIGVVDTPVVITAPAHVCAGVATTLGNATHGAAYTVWNFGDGVLDSGFTVSHLHAYAAAGTYTIRMSTVVAGCRKTASKVIVVDPKPAAAITMSPSIPCPAPVIVTFTGSATDTGYTITGYDWSWVSGGTASGQNAAKNYTASIRDAAILVTTSAAGCRDTATMDTVTIRKIYTNIHPGTDYLILHDATGCLPLVLPFEAEIQTDPPGSSPVRPPYLLPANSWRWDFGDGNTSTLDTPTHTYYNVQNYFVRCIITTANGCTDTGYRTVHGDTSVKPTFIASPTTACPKSPVTLINRALPLSSTRYTWQVFAPIIGLDTNVVRGDTSRFNVYVRHTGIYTVVLYSDHNGCVDSFKRIDYLTISPSEALFKDSIYCPPSTTVKFINTSPSPTSQKWFFGDGDTSSAYSPVHTYAGLGSYFVKLITYNSLYGCSDTLVKQITLFQPSISFTANDTDVCVHQFVRFQGSFGGPARLKPAYSWRFDNYVSAFDTLADYYDYAFFTRGYHDVTFYVKSVNGCIDSVRKPASILAAEPAVAFGALPPVGCLPLNVLFTDSTIDAPGVRFATKRWYFGDGDSSTALTPTVRHTYSVVDSYSVSLVVVDSFGCQNSLTKFRYVTVRRPLAAFTAGRLSGCRGDTFRFASASYNRPDSTLRERLSHRWDFGDGSADTGYYPQHRYLNAGSYTVRLIATDGTGCSDTLVRPAYIAISAPHAAFTPSTNLAVCPPVLVHFSNSSTTAVSYTWDFGNGGSSAATNPISTFINPGRYSVTLTATDVNGCTDTARDTVRVLGYNGAFTYTPTNGCVPMTVQFSTPIAAIPQIIWDFGDGASATTTNSGPASHIYPATGAYLPKVIFSNGTTCPGTLSVGLDTIYADKVTADFHWSVPCSGVPFSLRDSSRAVYSPPNAWTWNFGGGNTASGATASASFSTPGPHPITLTAINATGCRDSVTLPVFINPPPIVRAPDDRGVCPGATASLTATGALTYTWSPASLVSCTACTTTQVSLTADTLLITVTGTDTNGCKNSDSVLLYKQIKTTSSTRPGGAICIGESFRLFAEGAEQYEWSPAASLDSPFIASPLATPTTTTTYIVAAKESSCLTDSQRVTVVVHPLPQFSAGEDQTIRLGGAVTLQATRSGIDHIVWKADTTLGCVDCFAPNAYPYYTRTYYATGYSEYGCAATDSVTVHVRCNGSLVYIPNTFTPNGDGLNDYFYPRGEGIGAMSIMRVYNRWGEVVFERANVSLNDELSGWDGRYKGALLPPDVYVYTMESRCATGEPVSFRGDISIVR